VIQLSRPFLVAKRPATKFFPHRSGVDFFARQTEEQLVDHAKQRRNPKKIHEDRIDQRLLIIYEASENIENLLRSEDPIAAINAQAKILKTPTLPARFRLWLFSYQKLGSGMAS
jgi:hypothetical protein